MDDGYVRSYHAPWRMGRSYGYASGELSVTFTEPRTEPAKVRSASFVRRRHTFVAACCLLPPVAFREGTSGVQ